MSPTRVSIQLLCSVSLALGSPPPALAAAVPAALARVAPARQGDFMTLFREALKVGATEEMTRLVRANEEVATGQILLTCEAISAGTNDTLEAEMAALSKAWKAAFRTRFPDEVYKYFSLLRPEIKVHRKELRTQYQLQNSFFTAAQQAGDRAKLHEVGLAMRRLGDAFSEIGDYFFASQSYLHEGLSLDEGLRKEDADLKGAHEAYLKCVQAREKIDLRDLRYTQTLERQQALDKLGFGVAAEGSAQPVEAAASAPLTLATTFEVVADLELYRRPIYTGDSIYAMWTALDLRARGSTAKFAAVTDSPVFTRTGASKVMIDADGDGNSEGPLDIEVPVTGKITPVELTLGKDENQRRWAFLAMVGGDRDTYNGLQPFNLAPSDEYFALYVAPAGSVVTLLGTTPLRVFDDNLDGEYGSLPKAYGYVGCVEGSFQPEMDSILVGAAKEARPWSEYVNVEGAWYRLESARGGNEIRATAVGALKTGKLKLSPKGLDFDWLVVKGTDKGVYEKSYFDLAAAKGGLEVPTGTYQLVAGQVSTGKKDQTAKSLVLPGRNTVTWTVTDGATAVVELGAPFGFDFRVQQDEASLTVVGASVAVLGKSGESYQRFWNCVPRPDVVTREEGKKRAEEGDRMTGPGSQEEVGEKGFQYAWFPFDVVMEKASPVRLEVQLIEKKNRLFGKIESQWR
jgi:hypothetical protein